MQVCAGLDRPRYRGEVRPWGERRRDLFVRALHTIVTFGTTNPSLRATSARRSSRVTTSNDDGRRSAAAKAAANCSASAARSGWTRRNLSAVSRIPSVGSISCQPSANCRSRRSAFPLLGCRSSPRARGEPRPRRTRPRSPTRQALRSLLPRATVSAGLTARGRAMAQLPRHPRISPAIPPLFDESGHRRGIIFQSGKLIGEQ